MEIKWSRRGARFASYIMTPIGIYILAVAGPSRIMVLFFPFFLVFLDSLIFPDHYKEPKKNPNNTKSESEKEIDNQYESWKRGARKRK